MRRKKRPSRRKDVHAKEILLLGKATGGLEKFGVEESAMKRK